MSTLPLRVDVHLSPNLISEALKVPQGHIPTNITGLCLDTRSLQPGDIFVALNAARDGHDFVDQAFEKKAALALVSRQGPWKGPCLEVSDTYQAFTALATAYRQQWPGKLIAISGSNGKTTTKQIVKGILGVYRETLMSPGTWNNHLGVPLTLLMLRPEQAFAVLEMGMNHAGELTDLAAMALPDITALTGIGKAHIENFGSLDKIADAKWELMQGVSPAGNAVVLKDDPYLRARMSRIRGHKMEVSTREPADVWLENIEMTSTLGYRFTLHYGSETLTLSSKLAGLHNVSNVSVALGIAKALGVPSGLLQEGLDAVEEAKMRLERMVLGQNILLVQDCYNANPTSMAAAINFLGAQKGRRRLMIIGDMLELGEWAAREHRDVGYLAAREGIERIYAVGQYSKDVIQGALEGGKALADVEAFRSKAELEKVIASRVEKDDVILVKASRGMKLETVCQVLRQQWEVS